MNKHIKCNTLKVDTVIGKCSSSLITRRRSLSQRKSLKILKEAKIKLQEKARYARNEYIGDRIMAHRGFMDFNNSEDILMCRVNRENIEISDDLSVPTLIEKIMLPGNGRLLKLTSRHKSPSYDLKLKALYDKNKLSNTSNCSRYISVYPDRILDAPMLSTECWNILDWNRKGVLAVALGNAVYLWHSSGGNVEELVKNDYEVDVSCVKWLNEYDGNVLAVGSADGKLTLWKEMRLYRTIDTQSLSKITTLACRKTLLSIGFESGLIQHYDLKSNKTLFSNNERHKKAIRQMKWSSGYVYLAVASKDGSVSVWASNKLGASPIADFKENNCGIEDVAWSPRQETHLLFAGGDGNSVLKVMDVKSRSCVRSLNGNCKMTSVLWAHSFHEIAVAAYNDNSNCCLRLYQEDSLKMITEMSGHKEGVIALIANPCSGVLATIGRDESIRLWSCFNNEGLKKSQARRSDGLSQLSVFGRLR